MKNITLLLALLLTLCTSAFASEFNRAPVVITGSFVSQVTSPSNASAVSVLTFTPANQILGTAAASSTLLVSRYSADALSARVILGKSRGAAIGTNTVVGGSDQLGIIGFCASDGTNACSQTNVLSASIEANVTGISGTFIAGNLQFKTQNITGTLTTALTLSNTQLATFASGIVSGGTKFTASGCSNSTTVGGATAGTFVSGTTGACTVTITMNGATGATAPNGWDCSVNNRTTANLMRQTGSTTTTATISGTTVTSDVISFNCMAY